MKSEIEKLGLEMRGEKVGIETLKQIQVVKAKIIKQAHDTYQDATSKSVSGLGIAFSWVNEAVALGNVLGKHKKIALEFEDMDGNEAIELKAYFVECLKKEGFNDTTDAVLLALVDSINKHVTDTVLLFKQIALFAKPKK
jgi:hypothetical protein